MPDAPDSSSDLSTAESSIWNCMQQGIHYPPEWKGLLTVEQGYRVQLGILKRHAKAGGRHAGWKVGLTARSIQEQVQYMERVFGFLLESGHLHAGAMLPHDELRGPNFENELCVTLAKPLKGPDVSVDEANAAIGAVAPGIEIVERRGDFAADPALSMADNVQQRYFVTGTPTTRLPTDLDLGAATVEVFINGERVAQAPGTEVMGGPAASVAWLANRLHGFGRQLHAGEHIMTGSFTRQFPIAKGDLIEAHFDPYGTVSAEFS